MFAFFTLIPLLQGGADAQATFSKPASVKREDERNASTSKKASETRAGKKAVVKC